MSNKIDFIKKDLIKLVGGDNHGHGLDHVLRVYNMSMRFCKNTNANLEIVALTSLLHDADDYKIFGDTGDKLPNANRIMQKNDIGKDIVSAVLHNVNNMGYSKRLAGIMPVSLEGKIVSDADMCDAIGATGIVRTMEYNFFKGNPFWDRTRFPEPNPTPEQYKASKIPNVDHYFEKMLKLKNLMLTDPGKKEAITRQDIMVSFLRHFFDENDAPEWIDFMNDFLAKQK